jgi:hypothetical protein
MFETIVFVLGVSVIILLLIVAVITHERNHSEDIFGIYDDPDEKS